MESITIGQIVAGIGTLCVLGGFIIGILRWYKATFNDRFEKIEKDVEDLKAETQRQAQEIQDSKEERLILINGLLACLKGVKQLGANGEVTQGIKDIEDYLIKKSHS